MIDTTVFQNKTAVYYTLGCKLNFSETSTIGKILREAGVRTVRKGEKADICVVNTCSVTEMADKKCRQAIHRLVKQHPGAFVVVTGCYAQLKPGDVAKIDGVDVVSGLKVRVVDERELYGQVQTAAVVHQGLCKGAGGDDRLSKSRLRQHPELAGQNGFAGGKFRHALGVFCGERTHPCAGSGI